MTTETTSFGAVMLNNERPMSCGMGHKLTIPCPTSELLYTNYQLPLRLSGSNITMFQSGEDDKDGFSAWSMFGCGHDDLLVYDREGRLYKHLPSKSSYKKLNPSDEQLFDFLEQDLLLEDGSSNVREVLADAAKFNASRCFDSSHTHYHDQIPIVEEGGMNEELIGLCLLVFCFAIFCLANKYGSEWYEKLDNIRLKNGLKFSRLSDEYDEVERGRKQKKKKRKKSRSERVLEREGIEMVDLDIIGEDELYDNSQVDGGKLSSLKSGDLADSLNESGLF